MIRIFALFMCLCVLPVPAMAQAVSSYEGLCSEIDSKRGTLKSGKSAYVPADGGTYTPGVDVHGKPVVSADLPGSSLNLSSFDDIELPIEIDLSDQFGLDLVDDIPGLDLEVDVAFFNIRQDGRVLFNGQDLTDNLQVLCTEIEISEQNDASSDGQNDNDAIILRPDSEDDVQESRDADINVEIPRAIPADQRLDGQSF